MDDESVPHSLSKKLSVCKFEIRGKKVDSNPREKCKQWVPENKHTDLLVVWENRTIPSICNLKGFNNWKKKKKEIINNN